MATIMIIEDDISIASALRRCVGTDEHISHIAYDGNAWLAMVQEILPDIVLLDVRLPGLGGLEVCQRIWQAHLATEPHIIIMTVEAFDRDYLINTIGADDYLQKPFDPMELLRRIRTLLEQEQPQPA